MNRRMIMIIEDEEGIREMTEMYLMREGYDVITAQDGQQALGLLESMVPDLILLDIEMPGIDGFTVCQKVRKKLTVPIIFLTVRRNVLDKVRCLELGGDDYMTKPFDFEELGARIKANIRRYYTYPKENVNILKYGSLEIHLHNYTCYLNGKKVSLSTREMELLTYFARHPNQVLSQEQLYNAIWSIEAAGNMETVKVHISFLRRKLETDHKNPKWIKTVRGFGYIFAGE